MSRFLYLVTISITKTRDQVVIIMDLSCPLPPYLLAAIVAEAAEAEIRALATQLHTESDEHDMVSSPYFEFGGPGRNQGGFGVPKPFSTLGKRRQYAPRADTRLLRVCRDWKSCHSWKRWIGTPPREGEMAWDEFRFKFRTPWPVFNYILSETRRSGYFPDETTPGRGRRPHPLGLKVSAALRYCTLGVPLEALESDSGCSRQAIQQFSIGYPCPKGEKKERPAEDAGWFNWFVSRFMPEWIRPPRNTNEVKMHQRIFASSGFPGAFASMDAVHCGPWDNCPSQDQHTYIGKEGFPTLVWNFCVSNTKWIYSMHGPFAGSKNDKRIVRSDPFIDEVRILIVYLVSIYTKILCPCS